MRKVVLFIAMSLDGYIADRDGNVDWLMGQDNDVETADSYADFEKSIDTVIMGQPNCPPNNGFMKICKAMYLPTGIVRP